MLKSVGVREGLQLVPRGLFIKIMAKLFHLVHLFYPTDPVAGAHSLR